MKPDSTLKIEILEDNTEDEMTNEYTIRFKNKNPINTNLISKKNFKNEQTKIERKSKLTDQYNIGKKGRDSNESNKMGQQEVMVK